MSDDDDRHGKPDHEHGPEERHGKPDHQHGAAPKDERRYDPETVTAGSWLNRAVLVFVLLALAVVVYLVSAAFFPRWWAQRVADQVNGSITAGTLWGLFYGFVFTFVPLLLLAQIRRRFLNWTWRGIIAVVAIILAAPNWMTLSVVIGNSSAAHAGERIFDVDAPGFRVATAMGSATGVVLTIVLVAAGLRLSRRRRQVKELKGKLSERERAEQDRSEGS